MDINLLSLNRITDKNPLIRKIFQFNIEDAKLVAELNFGTDSFLIFYSDNSSNYLIYFYYTDISPLTYDDNSNCLFILCQTFEEVLEVINSEIIDKYYGLIAHYSKKWWSFLPEWVVLKPIYIDSKQQCIFIQEINKVVSEIDYDIDLSKNEHELLKNWNFKST